MDAQLKQELHQLIDNCDNELLLQQAKNILQNNDVKDWWDELVDEDDNGSTLSSMHNSDFLSQVLSAQQLGATE